MSSPEPFEIVLSRRLHPIWEKSEALTALICNAGDNWTERRPITAPYIFHQIADGLLELACELDVLAADVAAEDKRHAERMTALGKSYAQAIGVMERAALTKRLGEIVRTPHEPPEPTP
jgi:hypothetical protein